MHQHEQESKTIQTYDTTAHHWAKAHAADNDWLWAAEHLKQLLPQGDLLEVGCGGGRDAAVLSQLGYGYLGTDASAGMVAVAQAQVPQATFRQCNVYDLAKLSQTFHGFWACAVLLHIPKARIGEALQAIYSVLKPGAVGMISVKDGDDEDFEVRDKGGQHEERLFAYWRKDSFTKVLTENGFRVLDYTYKPKSKRTNWHVFFVAKT
jgi:2-polyprenyl-3-methyl-5-hydroxy-6-metoxy-1,4-benzoquinol methylase